MHFYGTHLGKNNLKIKDGRLKWIQYGQTSPTFLRMSHL